MRHRHWTAMEEEQLRVLRIAGLTQAEIAADMGRTRSAINSRSKLPRLRIRAGQRAKLTPRQEKWLWAFRNSETNLGAATLMGTTARSAKRFRAILRAKGVKAPAPRFTAGRGPRP